MVKCHQAALCKAKWMLLLCIRLHRAATHIQNTFINHHIEKLVSYFNSQVFGLSRQCSLAQSEEEVLSFRDDYLIIFEMEFCGFYQTRHQIILSSNARQTSE